MLLLVSFTDFQHQLTHGCQNNRRQNHSPIFPRVAMSSIAIVDEDKNVRDTVADYLSLAGFDVVAFSSAQEILTHLETNKTDIVITDIPLKKTNGFELTGLIKRKFSTDVIILTGYSSGHSYEAAINNGASDFVFKPVRFEELLLRLKRVLHEQRLTADRNEMLTRLKRMAITDPLTRLFNLRHFYNQLEKEIDRFNRYNRPLVLMLLDIDNFKIFNDTYGHLEGDRVLVNLGKVIRQCLRTMDSGYRFGGEEFTILLPETTVNEGLVVAERVQNAMRETTFSPPSAPGPVATTLSIGITEYAPEEPLKEFVRRSDRAMYLSKAMGKDLITMLTKNSPE